MKVPITSYLRHELVALRKHALHGAGPYSVHEIDTELDRRDLVSNLVKVNRGSLVKRRSV
jgi:hypothetical protein